ncbi:LCP family protein [Dethiobacter alkaliphilus]|uniref:Cell envelope-related transcriptional attenuator n=1 Tax=Dethiobacter alkaliphilus AHT 1 TaxID=555088 RepID=C0GGS1_DETAL|nr:LCP family protein [Dethiobacter alkaliphilus]EEG77512.1 cell envelope-related transcriptional attenuator [Dethiobacter alkaliphilus AHT 1]
MAKKRNTKRIIAFVMLFALLAGAAWAYSVWVRVYDRADDDYVRDPSIEETPGITNILIIGVDAAGDVGRADSIIVMSLNEATEDVSLISIPRDSRVEIPDRGMDKINHAMAYQGISLMRSTVENLLGVPIHHYVFTNFSGFQNIVDSVGGVTLDVERSMTVRDPDTREQITLQPGVQKLNGAEALSYVRFRRDGEGDFGRMRRQQQFLKAIADEIMESTNVLRMPQFLENVARHVRTDMSIPRLLRFSNTAARLDLEEVNAIQLKGSPTMIDRVSYVRLDEEFMKDTIQRYLRWEQAAETEEG